MILEERLERRLLLTGEEGSYGQKVGVENVTLLVEANELVVPAVPEVLALEGAVTVSSSLLSSLFGSRSR